MMDTIDEHPLPFISPSVVTFYSPIDDTESKSKSMWNPDWTIQNEISITIDKSVNESTKLCKTKIQILSGIIISLALILSVVVPIMIVTTDPFWPAKKTITTISTTRNVSNSSNGKVERISCENLLNIENVNFIGFDLYSTASMTLSNCCLWCFNVSSCHAFTYEIFSTTCYLKSMINNNEIIDKRYQSAQLK